MLKQLRTQVIRVNLVWGGPNGVAKRRPVNPTNPNDPAYNWAVYDRTVQLRAAVRDQGHVLDHRHAALGERRSRRQRRADEARSTSSASRPPRRAATAGRSQAPDGRILPAVRSWLAWNEPNNPAFLRPQYRKVKGKFVIQSAIDYAKICNAIVKGVRKTTVGASKVACGVTGPRGQQQPELEPGRRSRRCRSCAR